MPPKTPPKVSIDDIKAINRCIITLIVDCKASETIRDDILESNVRNSLRSQPHYDYVDLYCNDELVQEGDAKIIMDDIQTTFMDTSTKKVSYEHKYVGFWGIRYTKSFEVECTLSKKLGKVHIDLKQAPFNFKKIYYYKGNEIFSETTVAHVRWIDPITADDIKDGKVLIEIHDTETEISLSKAIFYSAVETIGKPYGAKLLALDKAVQKYGKND